MSSFEKITYFRPAYDKRDTDPHKNYGIHCVDCFMVLKNEKGAVHFMFSTGMWLKQNRDLSKDMNKLFPMGVDVGYHSPTPHFEGQNAHGKCQWLDDRECYCDGSALRAEEWIEVLLNEGSDPIWKMLEEEHNILFNGKVEKEQITEA